MFKPLNRYLHVEVITVEAETNSGILLPDDFNVSEERHAVASVKSWAPDVRFAEILQPGKQLLVDKSMVENVTIDGREEQLILDNYVLGLIT